MGIRDLENIYRAWNRFSAKGELFEEISPLVLRSWLRSKKEGVSGQEIKDMVCLSSDSVQRLQLAHESMSRAFKTTVVLDNAAQLNANQPIIEAEHLVFTAWR